MRNFSCLPWSSHYHNLDTFLEEIYNIKHFPTDNSKLAEMEFYLVDDLECDLIVFHPYRTLLTLCRKEEDEGSAVSEDGEAGEVGTGVDDGPRYWGSGQGQLELAPEALQTAWKVLLFLFCRCFH